MRKADGGGASCAADPASRSDLADAPAWLAVRREDVAELVAAYRRESRSPRQWAGVAVGLGGPALSVLLLSLGARYEWPAALAPVFLAGGWGSPWRRATARRAGRACSRREG